jgi:hypothetical protein
MTSAAPLDYAMKKPGHFRRHAAGYMLLASAIVAAGVIFYYHQPLLFKARLLYWQRQCLNYERPGDAVITELDPRKADELMRHDSDYQPGGRTPAAVLFPVCLRQYQARATAARLKQVGSLMGPGPATIFLHERKTPAGKSRLVFVESTAVVNALSLPNHLTAVLVEPATLLSPARPIPLSQRASQYSGPFVPAHLCYGQADPNDPTHFTIEFTLRDHLEKQRRGVIDARIRDNDTVSFTIRDPATTQKL